MKFIFFTDSKVKNKNYKIHSQFIGYAFIISTEHFSHFMLAFRLGLSPSLEELKIAMPPNW